MNANGRQRWAVMVLRDLLDVPELPLLNWNLSAHFPNLLEGQVPIGPEDDMIAAVTAWADHLGIELTQKSARDSSFITISAELTITRDLPVPVTVRVWQHINRSPDYMKRITA